jgi:hypothetical protein
MARGNRLTRARAQFLPISPRSVELYLSTVLKRTGVGALRSCIMMQESAQRWDGLTRLYLVYHCISWTPTILVEFSRCNSNLLVFFLFLPFPFPFLPFLHPSLYVHLSLLTLCVEQSANLAFRCLWRRSF